MRLLQAFFIWSHMALVIKLDWSDVYKLTASVSLCCAAIFETQSVS